MTRSNIDFIKLSREIAYRGKIGRRREEFCTEYIKHKKVLITRISKMQNDEAKAAGESITCRRGCPYSSCCMEYVDATVQECEAIVYYLYHNEKALRLFLSNYPSWRQKVKMIEDIFRACKERSSTFMEVRQRDMGEAGERYFRQKIPCPFLENNLCSIYEVRPYACAGYYVTSPLSHCDPDYSGEVPVKRHLPSLEVLNTEFYYEGLERPFLLCMQEAVYGILEQGYFYLSAIPGLEGLDREAIRDRKIRRKYMGVRSI